MLEVDFINFTKTNTLMELNIQGYSVYYIIILFVIFRLVKVFTAGV